MVIRDIAETDIEKFYYMLCKLDEETKYMMYEPGERQKRTSNLDKLSTTIKKAVLDNDFLMISENDKKDIIGYIWAERGRLNRIMHTAYVVVGIRKSYQKKGIGTEFFKLLDIWSKENNIKRLELTVECANVIAIELYKKSGFNVEGIRKNSMQLDGQFVDEYYMGKIIDL